MRPRPKTPAPPVAPILALLALFVAPPVFAAWQPDGVRLSPLNAQFESRSIRQLLADGSGGAYVVWLYSLDNPQIDGQSQALTVQRVDILGDRPAPWPAGGTNLLSWFTGGFIGVINASSIGLVSDGQGGAIHSLVSYSVTVEPHNNFNLADIEPNGTINGWPGFSGDFSGSAPAGVTIDGDGAGGVVVLFYGQTFAPPPGPPGPRPLYAFRLDPTGAYLWGPTDLTSPGLATGQMASLYDGAGGGYFAWVDQREVGDPDLYVMRLDATGGPAPGWPAGGVLVCGVTGDHFEPHLVKDGLGGVFVQWRDDRDGITKLYAHHLLAGGTLAPGIPVDGAVIPPAGDGSAFVNMASDGQGGIFLVRAGLEASVSISRLHRLDGALQARPGWPANGIALNTLSPAWGHVGLAADDAGGAFVSYRNGFGSAPPQGLYAQHYAGDGTIAQGWTAPGYRLSGNGGESQLVRSGTGAIVAWSDYRPGNMGVYAQRVVPDGPVATQLSLVAARVDGGRVSLHWYAAEAVGLAATIERCFEDSDWSAIGDVTGDGTGHLLFEDLSPPAGARVAYRAAWIEDGLREVSEEVWVEVPGVARLALSSPRPNPAPGRVSFAITLAEASPATLDLLDLAGRRVGSQDLAGLGAGSHVVDLDVAERLAPGLYVIRLTQDGVSRSVRLLRTP